MARAAPGAPPRWSCPPTGPARRCRRSAARTLPVALPASSSEALKALGQREGATLFMVLLAAFQVLLSRYSGQDDIAVGSPIAGRNRGELGASSASSSTRWCCARRLDGDAAFRELLRQVRETALGAYAHQDVPFERLVEELQPARDLSRAPLFQVMFALQNTPTAAAAAAGR